MNTLNYLLKRSIRSQNRRRVTYFSPTNRLYPHQVSICRYYNPVTPFHQYASQRDIDRGTVPGRPIHGTSRAVDWDCWEVADFGSYGWVIGRSSSGAFQTVRESSTDCLTIYRTDYTDMYFLCYQGSVRSNKGMWGNIDIGVVIYGRIRKCYLCFTYVLLMLLSLSLVWF